MAVYAVQARPRVRKSLRQLDALTRQDVQAVMRALADDPRPAGATAQGSPAVATNPRG